MANSLGTRPIVLDTPGATSLISHRVKIVSLTFIDYTADTDSFTLNDKDGNLIATGNGESDLSPVELMINSWVDGIQLASITAGARLILYVE